MTSLLLKTYLKINDKTQSEFAVLTGLPKQSVNYWLKEGKDPVYVDYNVVTKEINKVHSENILFRRRTRWEAEE